MDDLRARLEALSLEQKVRLLTGADAWALHPEPAAGLRRVVTSDGPAGVRGERWDEREPSANVPSPTALAATWDVERIERLGRLLAFEARRKGVDVLLAPTVNLHRTPFGGRHFEYLSEDPLLTGAIGGAYVRGVQSGGVAATVKHFVANDSETERFTLDAQVDERPLRELYLAPFEQIVQEAQPWAVMAAYNAVNGHTMTESPMLRDVLKDEWGFDGVVMSDWFAARTTEGAGRAALDLAMPGPSGPWAGALVAAVRDGRVPEAAVDDKVLRILRLGARVGALEGVEPPPAPPSWSDEEVTAELRGAAAASFVLVRNEDAVLPLDRDALRRVAVLGPNAAVGRTLGGGSATVFPSRTVSPVEGLFRALERHAEVVHAPGVRSHTRLPVASRALLHAPDGTAGGVGIEFFDADGTRLGTETRFGGAYTWDEPIAGGIRTADVAAIELRTTLRAIEAGEHVVGCSALGRVRMVVDGAERFDARLQLPAGADPVEGIMRPPQHGAAVPLGAGEEARIRLRYEPGAGDMAFGTISHALQLNVEPPWRGDDEELDRAAALAAEADVAVVVVGTTEEVESEGFDRESLALPGRQDELVERVAAANPQTVVVVNAGAPVLLPWADRVPAIVLTWFPGQEFGDALADVLLGACEPGGRLPTSWPASEDGLPSARPVDGVLRYDEGMRVGYRDPGRDALFPFGHGLGYTTWEYLGLDVDGDAVRVRLRNTGNRRGREVVQVYASREDSGVERPARWLVGFAIAEAGSGEEVTVRVTVPPRRLAHWDGGRFAVEPGTFTLGAGRSSRDVRVHAVRDGG